MGVKATVYKMSKLQGHNTGNWANILSNYKWSIILKIFSHYIVCMKII